MFSTEVLFTDWHLNKTLLSVPLVCGVDTIATTSPQSLTSYGELPISGTLDCLWIIRPTNYIFFIPRVELRIESFNIPPGDGYLEV